jgi:hypothetical protein
VPQCRHVEWGCLPVRFSKVGLGSLMQVTISDTPCAVWGSDYSEHYAIWIDSNADSGNDPTTATVGPPCSAWSSSCQPEWFGSSLKLVQGSGVALQWLGQAEQWSLCLRRAQRFQVGALASHGTGRDDRESLRLAAPHGVVTCDSCVCPHAFACPVQQHHHHVCGCHEVRVPGLQLQEQRAGVRGRVEGPPRPTGPARAS